MDTGYIKSNMTKHISPKLFYPHELKQMGEIDILQTKSCDNLADLFTKSLPTSSFHKCVQGIGIRRLRDLQGSGGEISYMLPCPNHHIALFSSYEFYSQGFSYEVFNEAILA